MDNIIFKEYFASLNSGCGFKNFFPSVLAGTNRLIILKGTPGSGKSSIMKKAASIAEERGYTAERIFCSSDPDSLDGVIIKELSTAIIDGTAPHTADPKYPAVTDFILNTADFLDEKLLSLHKDEIISLSEKKSFHYLSGYKFLSCRSGVRQLKHELTASSILYEKMRSAVKRIFTKETKKVSRVTRDQSAYKILVRASASFGSKGITVKNTFADALKIYEINDKHDISSIFLSLILSEAKSAMMSTVISPDPFDPDMMCALYLPEIKVLFCTSHYTPVCDCETVAINSDRFVDKEKLKKYKARIKFLNGCLKSFEETAQDEFVKAMETHLNIEKFYISSMDFKKLDIATDELMKKIF